MAASSSTSNDKQTGKFVPSDIYVLQKHVFFFDRNQDGLVYPWETYKGFRAIGCGILLSIAGAVIINVSFSQKTRPGKFPSLLFPIEVENIKRAEHGSNTGVYDSEGRFQADSFEEMFQKNAHTNPDGLTQDELMGMVKRNRQPYDFGGWFAAYTEWKLLYSLCKDKNGLLHKDKVRAVYDGSIFYTLEEERNSAKTKK